MSLQLVKLVSPIEIVETPMSPADRVAAGFAFTIWGYRSEEGVYDDITLAEIAAAQAAGWPDYAIWINVLGTVRPGGGSGSFTLPSVSLQPVVAAATLLGAQSGVFALPGVSVQPVVAAVDIVGQSGASFLMPAVSIQPVVVAPSLVGSTSGAFAIPSISTQPVVVAPSLNTASIGSFAMPAVSVQPVIVAPTLEAAAASTIALNSTNFDFRASAGSTITENSPSAGELTLAIGPTGADYAIAVYKTEDARAAVKTYSVRFSVSNLTGDYNVEEVWEPIGVVNIFNLCYRDTQAEVVGGSNASTNNKTLFKVAAAQVEEGAFNIVGSYTNTSNTVALMSGGATVIAQSTTYRLDVVSNGTTIVLKLYSAADALLWTSSALNWSSIANPASTHFWLFFGELSNDTYAGGTLTLKSFEIN